jgi:hypothetical protein
LEERKHRCAQRDEGKERAADNADTAHEGVPCLT